MTIYEELNEERKPVRVMTVSVSLFVFCNVKQEMFYQYTLCLNELMIIYKDV